MKTWSRLMVAERTAKPLVAALGSRTMWLSLRGKGHDVARCIIERLYRQQGWEGARYGKKPRTTIPDPGHERAPDLVHRRFFAPAPNRLWVADFTHVATWSGKVYIAFVIDAYCRRIVGWRVASSMTTTLVLDALEHALFTRAAAGFADVTGLVSHSDAGSQGGFNWSSQHPLRGGVDGQASGMGDSGDGSGTDEVAGGAFASSGGGAGVLAGDRQRSTRRGGCRGGRRVAGGRCAVVPPRWRDVTVRLEGVLGQVPDLRRA